MSDVWTIYFDPPGRPVGVSGPRLPVPEGGWEAGMATLEVIPRAPMEDGYPSGPTEEALEAAGNALSQDRFFIRDLMPGVASSDRASNMMVVFAAAAGAAVSWRRRRSSLVSSPEDAERVWGAR